MNYFKAAESLLSSVRPMEAALENLRRREQRLLDSGKPRTPGSMHFDKPFTDSRFVSDTLEELLAVSEVAKNIAHTQAKLEEIARVVAQLTPEQQKLLHLWYIERRPKEKIMETLHISSMTSLYNLRNIAVAQFALRYYGAAALPSI